MTKPFDTISFLSDYGTDDEFVGVVKSVIRSFASHVTVLDITHGVAPCDVRAGGLALARAAEYLVPSVVLAVVDPGVGTPRRPIAVEVGDGQAFLVGPDNGLLAPAVGMVGGATAAVVLDNTDIHLAAPGPTFDGRDVFAPAAAQLCNGTPLATLGTPIDPAQLLPGVLPVSERNADGSLLAEVLWVDRFGNVQLNVEPEELTHWGSTATVAGDTIETRNVTRVGSFGEIGVGAVGLLTDSYGLVMLAVDRGTAAGELGLGEGDRIVLAEATAVGQTTPVQLSKKAKAGPTATKPEEPAPVPPHNRTEEQL